MTNFDMPHLTAGRPKTTEIENSQNTKPLLIGICGGSASGKSTIASNILANMDNPAVALVSMDSFYKVLNEQECELANRSEYNFDCPEAFDFGILLTTLQQMKQGRQAKVPIYNFATHCREEEMETVNPAPVIIFEDADDDIRLARRLHRDIALRGRTLEGVIKQYTTIVQPSFKQYIAPLKKYADIIIPRGGETSEVATLHIVQYIRGKLNLTAGCNNKNCLCD